MCFWFRTTVIHRPVSGIVWWIYSAQISPGMWLGKPYTIFVILISGIEISSWRSGGQERMKQAIEVQESRNKITVLESGRINA